MPFDTSMYQNFRGGTGLAALADGLKTGIDLARQREQAALQEQAAKRQQEAFEADQAAQTLDMRGKMLKQLGETASGLYVKTPEAQEAEYKAFRDNQIAQGAKPQWLPESFAAARPMIDFYHGQHLRSQQGEDLKRRTDEAQLKKINAETNKTNAEAFKARAGTGKPPKGFHYSPNPETGEMELTPEISLSQAKQLGLHEMGQRAEEQYQAAVKDKNEYDPTQPGQWIDNSEWAPAWMRNDKANAAQSAQSAWVEAYLRDASGAAIPPSERMAYAKDFFPRPGDDDTTIANKAILRAQKAQNALYGAGPAAMYASKDPQKKTTAGGRGASGGWGMNEAQAGNAPPRTVIQNGHTYTLNPKTGKYE